MKKIAFCFVASELNFFKGVISYIPCDFCDVFLTDNINDIKYISTITSQNIKELVSKGYNVEMFSFEKLEQYETVVSGSLSYEKGAMEYKVFKNIKNKILLHHSTDAAYSGNNYAQYHILNYEFAISRYMYTKFNNPPMYKKLLELPHEHLNYGTYSGIYHINEWVEKRYSPKEVLREELEDFLQVKIDPNKPIVAFFEDKFCNPNQVFEAIKKLTDTNKFTVIAKYCYEQKLENKDVIVWSDSSFAPNLLRFSADFILAGFRSGTLSSSIMLGLKIIPFYTSLVRRNVGSSHWINFIKAYAEDERNFAGFALNLLETDILTKRMENKEYWQNYQENLAVLQKTNYGNYSIEGAGQGVASSILKVHRNGSFGNSDTIGIMIKPEFLHLYPEFM